MTRAYSTYHILSTNFERIEWGPKWVEAFHNPEPSGVWCVWGNSGNAKTRFMIELAMELSKTYKIFYNSLEEGKRLTMQLALKDAGVEASNRNFLIGKEPLEEMDERLSKRKAPRIAFIDSIQYARTRFVTFKDMVDRHPDVLFIVSSHAEGKEPKGKVAQEIKYDADLKIRVEGYKAISNGRFNPGGEYTIWGEGEKKYWGTEKTQAHETN